MGQLIKQNPHMCVHSNVVAMKAVFLLFLKPSSYIPVVILV